MIWTAVGSLAAVAAVVATLVATDTVQVELRPPAPDPTPEPAIFQVYAPGQAVRAFEQPTPTSRVPGNVEHGTYIEIECTWRGEFVSGNGQTDNLWNRTQLGYIPDVFVDTGSVQAQKPTCTF